METGKGIRKYLLVSCWLILTATTARPTPIEKPEQKPEKTVYDYALVSLDGKEVSLSVFKRKVLLIVNLASQSIFRDQIALLEELQKTYKDKGLVVIGVPSNDFGAQEPGSDADVQKTYSSDFHLSFPVFARASVRGKDQAALYAFLTSNKKGPTAGDVHWSYTKFVVDRNGKGGARFEPHAAPDSPEPQMTLEQVLEGKFKPPAQKGNGEDSKKGTRDRDEGPRS